MTIYGILRALRGGWGLPALVLHHCLLDCSADCLPVPTSHDRDVRLGLLSLPFAVLIGIVIRVAYRAWCRRVLAVGVAQPAESGCNRTGTPRATGNVNFATGSSILTPRSRWHEPICPRKRRIPRSTLRSMTCPDAQLLNPDAPGVLVTGAAGEVGHAILRGLAAGGAREVVATDLRSVDMDGAACVQGDLLIRVWWNHCSPAALDWSSTSPHC